MEWKVEQNNTGLQYKDLRISRIQQMKYDKYTDKMNYHELRKNYWIIIIKKAYINSFKTPHKEENPAKTLAKISLIDLALFYSL